MNLFCTIYFICYSYMSTAVLKSKFRESHTLTKRKDEAQRIRSKYPNRIPVICEVTKTSEQAIKLDRSKYLIPSDLTVGQFLVVIRKRIKLGPEHGLYLFTQGGELPACSLMMNDLYRTSKDTDEFLYLTLSVESAFG